MTCVAQGNWHLWGRNGVIYTERYPELEVLRRLPSGTMLDGELVLIRDGRADFHALMSRHRRTPAGSLTWQSQSYMWSSIFSTIGAAV
jgi:ATP-dependent DNA ligase